MASHMAQRLPDKPKKTGVIPMSDKVKNKVKYPVTFSLLPSLEFFLRYSKAPAAADEQHLNLCVCTLRHKRSANTQHSVLVWFTSTLYTLRHRGS